MVNSTSPVYRFSFKVGLVIGNTIRFMLIGGIAVFVDGKLGGSKPAPAPRIP
jgi:hypothetical protein